MLTKRAHIFVTGRVQGVCYRAWVSDRARRLELGGWVRNRFDGRVEAVFEGPADLVEKMVEWCHEGPVHARVDSLLDDDSEPPEGLIAFDVKGTA